MLVGLLSCLLVMSLVPVGAFSSVGVGLASADELEESEALEMETATEEDVAVQDEQPESDADVEGVDAELEETADLELKTLEFESDELVVTAVETAEDALPEGASIEVVNLTPNSIENMEAFDGGEAERRKNELVAYLAHDIRTPLTSVVGYLSLMNEAPDLPDEQRKRYVSAALAKAELLDTLTAEFFEITRYNLATIPIERTDVGVRLFLEQIAEEFLPEMQRRSITTRVEALEDAEIRIDPDKMARAIGNVVRNAVAYADDGSEVVLSARRADDAGWEIVVSDQGREIAPEHLESIFDRFYREDNARSSSGNAGLGLAIAKEIVEAHGGSIRAESADGTTRFIILLP
ncbi:sensor histidine kinase [Slackia heliotrinireducens]|uniref:sensor histidine kinase n=1 Tax=Slackia heliotrinireducens TaxID=84110 RepID=UPI00331575E7